MTDRDIKLVLTLDVSNDEASHYATPTYVSKQMMEVAKDIFYEGGDSGKIRDGNGNTIGEWSLDGDLD